MLHLVLITAPKTAAPKLARILLRERLIACANLVPQMQSIFWWAGKLDSARETLLILKCPSRNVKRVLKRVRELHPYETPEILALRVTAADKRYARWVLREAREPGHRKPLKKAAKTRVRN